MKKGERERKEREGKGKGGGTRREREKEREERGKERSKEEEREKGRENERGRGGERRENREDDRVTHRETCVWARIGTEALLVCVEFFLFLRSPSRKDGLRPMLALLPGSAPAGTPRACYRIPYCQ